MTAVILPLVILICAGGPAVTATSCSPDCRPAASCCSETQCTQNELDPEDSRYQMSHCVAPGDDLELTCDPGGECLFYCSWETPGGSCSWSDGTVQCSDNSVSPAMSGGNCNIRVSNVGYRHAGPWKCKVNPASHTFSDFVNVTVSSDCSSYSSSTSTTWWRYGWTAGLLWSGVVLLIIIIIIIIITLIYCFCPAICVCFVRETRGGHGQHKHHHHQAPVVEYSEVRRDRRRGNNFHEPVVLEDERTQRSVYDREIFERRNIPDHRGQSHVLGHHQQVQDGQYEVPRSVDYQVPRIYASSNTQMRTAKKRSNFDNIDLEERIRRASGVARQEHV